MVMEMKAQQADALNQQNENNKKWVYVHTEQLMCEDLNGMS